MSARRPRIAFLYPPFGPVRNEPNLPTVKANYGEFPNLSLLYAAGAFRAAGAEVALVDASVERLTPAQAVARLRAFGPDLVGVTITTYLFHQTLTWLRCVKRALDVPTLVGGQHLAQYPRETLRHPEIDYALAGEAEITARAFLDHLAGGADPEGVPGLWWRADGEVRHGPAPTPLADVDAAPLPARDLLDNARYYSFISQRRNFTPLLSSRGCPRRCAFCEQGHVPYRGREPAAVIEEIVECVARHGVRELDVFDSAFTTERTRVLAICEGLRARSLDVAWAARSRLDTVDPEMLTAMAAAGCRRIYYGIESGDPELRRRLGKAIDEDRIHAVLRATRAAGMAAFGYFMLGVPGETAATARATAELAARLPLDFAQFSKLTPLPGTAIYRDLLAESGGRDYWREYVLDERREVILPRPGTTLDDDEVTRLTRACYRRFYYRPGYVLQAVARLRSARAAWRGARAFVQMARGG